MSTEEQPEEFYLELGDIIKINAPDNSDIDGKTFYIDYLDENRATVVDPETLAELVLDILDGQFTDNGGNISISGKDGELVFKQITPVKKQRSKTKTV